MEGEKRYLVDVGIENLPFPTTVASRVSPNGQPTIVNISINARLMREFEARWIDKFIQIAHRHREKIATTSLRENITDYLKGLNATMVKINFDYPFFIEKITPASKEKCMVKYRCSYLAKVSSTIPPKIVFTIAIPLLTSDPASSAETPGGLFGQLSVLSIAVESDKDIYPETLVDIADKHALAPVYSYLTEEDQKMMIQRIHAMKKTSVVMSDEVKRELARNSDISWYEVRCSNFSLLHNYNTLIGIEKSMWLPDGDYDDAYARSSFGDL
jgi:GTP cyclohydrolase I